MVLVERYCVKCGAVCLSTAPVCTACGTSLKATISLNEEASGTISSLRLAHHLRASQLFKGRYRILRQVGVGGFGAVYEAEDTREHRQVAIKEIGLGGLTSQQMIEATGSFNREVQLLSSLKHHSIPRIYEQLTDTEHWYLVMDFIAGKTLEESLAQAASGRLPLEQALWIGIQLCDVLGYLHSRQPPVIFRDVKPANILLTPEQKLYLIDFGVARQYKPGKLRDTIAFGSPGYASPEQYGRAQTTPRADIYSLGAMLHQMLTGQDPSLSPFHFQPLRTYDRTLPVELEKLVVQMLELDMERRPESAEAVRRRLQSLASSRTVAGQRQTTAQGTTSRPQASAVRPSNVFSTLGVTVYMYRGHGAPVNTLAWSPDGSSIASCDDRALHIWNAFQSTSPHVFSPGVGHASQVDALSWSPDGHILATASEDHTVRLWYMDSHPRWWQMLALSLGFRSRIYELHASPVGALSWSPDGHMIVSAEEKSAVHVWDVRTGERLLVYQGHSDAIEDVAWSPDGLRIASCSIDHTVRVWSAADGENLRRWRAKGRTIVHTLAWSPDGRYLAYGGSNGAVQIWDVLQDRQVYIYRGHKDAVISVAWSPDGQRIASASFDSTVHVWGALDGNEVFIYGSHEDSVLVVAWSPDGQHLASAGRDAAVHVWKAV